MDTQRGIEKIHAEDLFNHPERVQQDDVFTKVYLEGIEYAKSAMKGFQEKSFFETSPSEDHENSEDLEDIQEAFSNQEVEDEERFLRLQLERENVYSPRTIEAMIAVAKNEQYKDYEPDVSFRGFEDDFSLYEDSQDVAKIAYVAKQAELAKVYLAKKESGQTLTEYETRVIHDDTYRMQGEMTHLAQTGVRGAAVGATLLAPESAGPIWSTAEGLNGFLDGLNGCHYEPTSLGDVTDIGVHTALGASLGKGGGAILTAGVAATAYGYATKNPDLVYKGAVTCVVGGVVKTIPILTEWKKSGKSLGSEMPRPTTFQIIEQNTGLDRMSHRAKMFGTDRVAQFSGQRVRPINGRMPINSDYAGKVYFDALPPDLKIKYPHGVPFNGSGHPDFTRYAQHSVKINVTGDHYVDFKSADKMAGITSRPKTHTWHHHEDSKTMLLIPKDIHKAIKHTGGVAKGGY